MPVASPVANLIRLQAVEYELERQAAAAETPQVSSYADDPVGYAEDVLGVRWWAKQQEIARALLTPPYRVLVKACHSVGKTHLGGGLVNWWFDSFNPGLTLTTAPTDRQVQDLLWKEVRGQRRQRGGFPGPRVSRLESSPEHFAHGFTARDADAFQGHHSEHSLIVFDEAVGVAATFWEAAESMFPHAAGHAWLAIFNPTDTSSQAYQEELTGNWHVIAMSALEHPNIAAELAGFPPPYPAAARLDWLNDRLKSWCTPVNGKPKATDVEWPPSSGQYLRPGPIAEARLLGRWPSQSTNGVWSDGAWSEAEQRDSPEPDEMPEIGCDVARFGDDFTSIHARRGAVSLHHESANGWSTAETAGRLKMLANEIARPRGVDPRKVPVKIDDDGVGGGVTDQKGEYNFIGVSGASKPKDQEGYPNLRSELWFALAERAVDGNLSLALLPAETRRELRRQAMAPTWKLDAQGRRVVEPKDETKKRIKRSPDDMDALNLAYHAPVRRGWGAV
jgi:hypothetical protein